MTKSKKTDERQGANSDTLLLAFFSCGALVSAFLPFYIHQHPDQFGPPLMQFSGDMENVLEPDQRSVVYGRQASSLLKPKLQFDRITTGSISKTKSASATKAVRVLANQPFPEDKPNPRLILDILFVTQNRALIVDDGKVETVTPGSALSNGETIETIKLLNSNWVLKTSNGTTYFWSPAG